MSLDDLIAQKEKQAKPKPQNQNFRRNNANATGNIRRPRSEGGGGIRGSAGRKQSLRSTPYLADRGSTGSRTSSHKVMQMQNQQHSRLRQPTAIDFSNSRGSLNASTASESKATVPMTGFSRLNEQPASGTRVTFANLKNSVDEDDLNELCSSLGEVKDIEMSSTRRGSKTAAIVLFARRSEAQACVSKFNGLSLDGLEMQVTMTDEVVGASNGANGAGGASKSVFERLQGLPATENVRHGLFGTSMNDNDANRDSSHNKHRATLGGDDGPVFSVTLDGGSNSKSSNGSSRNLVQPFAATNSKGLVQPFGNSSRNSNIDNRTNAEPISKFRGGGGGANPARFLDRTSIDSGGVQQQQQQQQQQQPRGGRGGGSRGGGRGGSRDARQEKKPVDLDADLDDYFASKP